jgi:hypothetical protein
VTSYVLALHFPNTHVTLQTSVGRVLESAPNINPYWVSGYGMFQPMVEKLLNIEQFYFH